MRNFGKHMITVRFLTASIIGLIFAFLIIFVFPAVEEERIYLKTLEIGKPSAPETLNSDDQFAQLMQKKAEGKEVQILMKDRVKKRNSKLMQAAIDSALSVITINHIEKIRGKREEYEARLNEYRNFLAADYEEQTAEKEKELEEKLMEDLEELRTELKQKYKSRDSQILLNNYNKILNLRIKIEVVAEGQDEVERLKSELQKIREEQNEILEQKNQKYNQEIEKRANVLINNYNQDFLEFQKNIKAEHSRLLAAHESRLQKELNNFIAEQRRSMNLKTEEKAEYLNKLAEKSLKKYF
ncbi:MULTISPECIES: hypothetical protein [unclassified Halanaerobium]|uniref:hypothetical protein n=1 Tax=unclassified Halanaerobium TaxID=2641197 RepID=UPI000DF432F8|nr:MULTISPECIES: hypothetical protein [unclassified Halanaerobium]RCW48245.1 hypothetical protein DFR78_10918 [Halanaerobium sp. MA284_MarDTE_T2]RCW85672.1 hypothetical protein DER71_11018 [Halanaerobium sp. DL-01]